MTESLRILAYKPRPEPQTIRMERLITCEPLELEYLYTVLDGHDVTLLDGMTDHRDPIRLASKLQPQVVMVSAFIANVGHVVRLARKLRQLPDPPAVFVGGPHAEVVPEHFFDAAIDGVFFADQLRAVAEVAGRIVRGRPYHDVPGGAFPRDGRFERNPAPPQDPADVPVPRRVLFERAPHKYFYLYYDRCASVKTAFGCNDRCNFCFCTQMYGGRFGPRPLEQVVDEIAGIDARNIFVLDDNFLCSRQRVLEFCRLVRERELDREFIVYGGARFIAANPDVMAEARQAGMTGVIVGFESIDDDELDSMQKNASRADNDRTVEICQELDIELFALFIVQPHWRPADFRRLASYIRRKAIAFATFATATPFPGTEACGSVTRPGPGPESWWRYDMLRLHDEPAHMSRLRFYLWMLYLYMAPSMGMETGRRLRRRFGSWGFVKAAAKSWVVGLEYLVKLALWR